MGFAPSLMIIQQGKLEIRNFTLLKFIRILQAPKVKVQRDSDRNFFPDPGQNVAFLEFQLPVEHNAKNDRDYDE